MVLIHFHLKEPIMVSRRKTFEIQFYTEVRAQTEEKDEILCRVSYRGIIELISILNHMPRRIIHCHL
jgi:nucleosome binding factor SPN SPT16 subunit